MNDMIRKSLELDVGDAIAKLVLCMLVLRSKDMRVTASITTISYFCELSRSTIIKKLKYLEDKGFISKKHNHTPNGNIKESTYTINESIFN